MPGMMLEEDLIKFLEFRHIKNVYPVYDNEALKKKTPDRQI